MRSEQIVTPASRDAEAPRRALKLYRKRRKYLRVTGIYLALIIAVVVTLFPFVWMISSSFKPMTEMFSAEPTLLPVDFTFENYLRVWQETDFPQFFFNSFKVSIIATAGSIIVSMYAAYALSRFRFPGGYSYGILLLMTQMFPHALLVISLFLIIQRLGLFNTHISLIVAYLAFSLPFCVWMLRGFFDAIPRELEESAMIDGASRLGAFHRIVLPLSGPGIAAVGMFAFILAWNEFLFALVFIQSSSLQTLPLGLASFMEEFTYRWDLLMAGAAITSFPILFFFMFMQRFIVQGLTAGALKG